MSVAYRVGLGALAVLITLMVLAATVSFYLSFAADRLQTAIYIALAVISAAMKLLILPAAKHAKGQGFLVAACWLLFASAVCFDALGVGGFFAMTRGGVEAIATDTDREHGKQEREVERLRNLADEYGDVTKTVAEIEPDLNTKKRLAGNCDKDARSPICKKVAELTAMKARAEERDKRESAWFEANEKLKGMPRAVGPPDGQALMFKSWLGESAGPFARLVFTVLGLILSEVGAPVCAFFALGGAGAGVPAPAAPQAPANDTAAAVRPTRRRKTAPASNETLLVMWLEFARGDRVAAGVKGDGRRTVEGSLRALGDAFGTSGATVQRQLQKLVAEARVRTVTGPNGTSVEIL